ncbi:MAG: selenocysteine-specific translation elongation factor [Chloroflexi bacterium]|nr:selenocysteine-specific translation elongation factor [Chloroflexota bacterium]
MTGIDPDRLAEEKQRGMTIDLGFAWLTLPNGIPVSLIDVPGHERFIKNMLAGVGGIDAVLLVVAADEGVMPQTREHLAILTLLGVAHGVIALTKSDRVEPDWLELVREQVRETLVGTALAEAPLVPVSAVTGAGLATLLAALQEVLAATPMRRAEELLRLPVDRAFTLSGHGTVVTGTLIGGEIRTGMEVEILPAGLRARVRSLQTHHQKVERVMAGTRVAVNVAGTAVEQLRRGDVLTAPGVLQPTTLLNVELRSLAEASIALHPGDPFQLYLGAAEVPGRLRLFDHRKLEPGGVAPAQLRLLAPIVARRGDRFIIRRPSPPETLGGGVVLDAHPLESGGKRRSPPVLTADLTGTELVAALLRQRRLWSIVDLAHRLEMSNDEVRSCLTDLAKEQRVVFFEDVTLSLEAWRHLCEQVSLLIRQYHQRFPLRVGMPREELRTRVGIEPGIWPVVERLLAYREVIAITGTAACAVLFRPELDVHQKQRAEELVCALSSNLRSPPSLTDVLRDGDDAEIFAFLIETGRVYKIGESLALPLDTYREIVGRVVEALKGSPLGVGQVRDLLGTNRRFALALLDHLDAERVTRREGDVHVLVKAPAQ